MTLREATRKRPAARERACALGRPVAKSVARSDTFRLHATTPAASRVRPARTSGPRDTGAGRLRMARGECAGILPDGLVFVRGGLASSTFRWVAPSYPGWKAPAVCAAINLLRECVFLRDIAPTPLAASTKRSIRRGSEVAAHLLWPSPHHDLHPRLRTR